MIEKNVKMIHTIFGSMAKIEIYLEKNESEFCGVFFLVFKTFAKNDAIFSLNTSTIDINCIEIMSFFWSNQKKKSRFINHSP